VLLVGAVFILGFVFVEAANEYGRKRTKERYDDCFDYLYCGG